MIGWSAKLSVTSLPVVLCIQESLCFILPLQHAIQRTTSILTDRQTDRHSDCHWNIETGSEPCFYESESDLTHTGDRCMLPGWWCVCRLHAVTTAGWFYICWVEQRREEECLPPETHNTQCNTQSNTHNTTEPAAVCVCVCVCVCVTTNNLKQKDEV